MRWGKNAVQEFLRIVAEDQDAYKFGVGNFGSVWFDMIITADLDGKPLSKRGEILCKEDCDQKDARSEQLRSSDTVRRPDHHW